MNNPQEIANLIRLQTSTQKINISQMFTNIGLGKNTLSNLDNGSMIKADSLGKIADYLNVSVDYLLGRTDEPTPTFTNVGNNNNGNQAIHGNVTVSQPQETDNRDLQLLQMIQELSPIDYARVVLFIDEMKNKGT